MSEPKSVILLPCRHVCVCHECVQLLDKCPVCRAPLLAYVGPPRAAAATPATAGTAVAVDADAGARSPLELPSRAASTDLLTVSTADFGADVGYDDDDDDPPLVRPVRGGL